MSPTKPPIWMERYQPIAYAAVSAIIGTNSIIIGKACAGLLKNAFHGDTSTFTFSFPPPFLYFSFINCIINNINNLFIIYYNRYYYYYYYYYIILVIIKLLFFSH